MAPLIGLEVDLVARVSRSLYSPPFVIKPCVNDAKNGKRRNFVCASDARIFPTRRLPGRERPTLPHFRTSTSSPQNTQPHMQTLLIGSGRVAGALLRRFQAVGAPLDEMWARNATAALDLTAATSTRAVERLHDLTSAPEVCLLAVSDGAIPAVAARLRPYLSDRTLVAHTSGATSAGVLAPHFPNYGSFYPLQSFTTGRTPNWETLPLLVSAANPEGEARLRTLARRIARRVTVADDATRNQLHVAAVLVNNFTNHLYRLAADFCAERAVDFSLLHPLIEETALKIQQIAPEAAQTGPARRGDRTTMERHLNLLEPNEALRELYVRLSEQIQQNYRVR